MSMPWIRVGCVGMVVCVAACRDEAGEPASSDPAPAAEAPTKAEGKATPSETAAPKAPEAPAPAGHGVVRVGGGLYTSASSATPIVVPPLAKLENAAPGVTIDIVGEQEGRLVIETLGGGAGQHHCAGELSGLSDLRLRLYVDPEDLLEITKGSVEHAFPDGTKVALSAGVPLAEIAATDPSMRRATVAGAVIDVPVPEASRGTFHEPGEARSRDGALGKIHAGGDPPPALRYGDGGTLAEGGLFRDGEALAHYGVTSKDGDAFLTVRSACFEAIVRTSTSRLTQSEAVATAGILGMMAEENGHFLASPYGASLGGDDEDVWGGLTGTEIGEAYGVGGLGLVGTGRAADDPPVQSVRTGAPIHWEDGTVAGQVLSAREFSGPWRDVAGRRCFDVKLVAGEDAALSLCFAAADLEEKAPTSLGTIGLRSSGTIGSGSGSSGYGSSGGFGGRGKRVPAVRQAKAEVKGSLDKDIIRRIVRAHINEVRYCYNKLLIKDPKAEGKVSLSFTIDASGSVAASSVGSNTTGDADVGDCIAKAVKRWKFPKPTGGGIVNVTYPFVLSPG